MKYKAKAFLHIAGASALVFQVYTLNLGYIYSKNHYMLRPNRDKDQPTVKFFNKFARYFGMLMTLIYVALGLFIMFMDEKEYNLEMSNTARMLFGGTLILYGIVRFVRAYQINSKSKRNRDDD